VKHEPSADTRRSGASTSSRTSTGAPTRRDRGEATAQHVVLVPVLVLLVLLVVQAAMWFHVANIARAAASRGAAVGSLREASAADAARTASDVVADNSAALATAPSVSIDAGDVVVSVRLEVPRIVPFFPSVVERTQREPRERFIPEDER
jgi:TadE-like protein